MAEGGAVLFWAEWRQILGPLAGGEGQRGGTACEVLDKSGAIVYSELVAWEPVCCIAQPFARRRTYVA